MVSVLMTVFNGMPYLKESVQSILNQSYTEFELVIVDDGSTDGSLEYLETIGDSRIKIIPGGRIGRGRALNLGLKHCKGKYIAINDADDVSMPNRLELQVEYLNEHKETGLLGSWKKIINSEADRIQAMPTSDSEIRRYFTIGQPIQHSTVMMRRDLVEMISGYDENLDFLLDRELFLRMAEITNLEQLPDVLVLIRRSEKQFFYNEYKGLRREKKSLYYRIKAINHFKFPKHWILREIVRSFWTLTPEEFRIFLLNIAKRWKK